MTFPTPQRRGRLGSIIALAATLVLVMAAAAQAATYTVTATTDDNPANPADCPPDSTTTFCSLREAVYAANSTPADDTINVPAGNYPLSNESDDPDSDADLDIEADTGSSDESAGALNIVGNNARDTTIRGTGISRIFELEGGFTFDADPSNPPPCLDIPGANVTLRNLTLTGGLIDDEGGAIYVNDGSSNCAGVETSSFDGRLTTFDVAIVKNMSREEGGGIASWGEVTLNNTLVAMNTARNGEGGGIYSEDSVVLTNTTVSSNSASDNGGGIRLRSDDIEDGTGGDETNGTLDTTNVTIAFNESDGQGGGVMGQATFDGFPRTVFSPRNTIIAHNQVYDDEGINCYEASGTASEGNNLENFDTCGLDGAGDKTLTDAGLLPRANNGGQTDTYALSSASPAIDAGTNAECPATDQRGTARPQGAACDIGAYEFVPPPPGEPTAPPPPPTVITNTVEVPTAFPRVRPRGLTLRVRKDRPTRRSLRLRSNGRVLLPAGLTAAQACTFGTVAVQVKANGKTVSTRIVSLTRTCRYSSRVTFNAMNRIRGRTLTVRARFFGNDRLRQRSSRRRSAGLA